MRTAFEHARFRSNWEFWIYSCAELLPKLAELKLPAHSIQSIYRFLCSKLVTNIVFCYDSSVFCYICRAYRIVHRFYPRNKPKCLELDHWCYVYIWFNALSRAFSRELWIWRKVRKHAGFFFWYLWCTHITTANTHYQVIFSIYVEAKLVCLFWF